MTSSVVLDREDHIRGPDGAPVLVIYGDYECPYTRVAYRNVQTIEGRDVPVCFAFRHFPLVSLHPHAMQAALAAEAAAEQGRFWEMHDLLFRRQKALGDDDLQAYAQQLGLDERAFALALTRRPGSTRVGADIASGEDQGVQGTPTLFLDGQRHPGYALSDLLAALRAGGAA